MSLPNKNRSWNDENAIDFKWSDAKEEDEEDITLANLIENYKSKMIRIFFQKSNWVIAVSYLIKRKIKKIIFELISNTKIFNINFVQRNCQQPRFYQTYRGIRQRGDWIASNTVITNNKIILIWILDKIINIFTKSECLNNILL